MSEMNRETIQKSKDNDAILAIGVFLGLFGLAVTAAVFWTESYPGKVVNLASGLLLLIVAAAAIWRGLSGKKSLK